MLLSVGSELNFTVSSVAIDDGAIVIYVSDMTGTTYRLTPEEPSSRPSVTRHDPMPVEAPEEAPVSPPAPLTRPPDYAPPEEVAAWLSDHPEDMGVYMRNTLVKRRLIAKYLSDIVGAEIEGSESFNRFIAVDPDPDSRWGDKSSAASMFVKGSMDEHIDRQTRQTAALPNGMDKVKQAKGKGDTLRIEDAAQWIKRSGG